MMQEITVNELEAMVENCFILREAYDKKKEEAGLAWNELEQTQLKLMGMLESMEMDSYKAKAGTFSYSMEESFKVPKDDTNRKTFFDYLKERGTFDTMITINSRTLNAFCRAEAEASASLDFQVPGIEKGSPTPKFTMRKAK